MVNKNIFLVLLSHLFLVFLFVFSFSNRVQAASFYLSPSSGNFKVGENFSVSLYVSPEGKNMNGAAAQINFPKDKLSVVSVSSASSIINFWADAPSFNNNSGTVNLSGVVLNPGYSGRSGKIVTVVFRAKVISKVNLSISSAQILANDGLGTNIFSGSSGANFSLIEKKEEVIVVPIIPSNTASKPAASVEREPELPIILTPPLVSSETHPQSEVWYNNNDPIFSWILPTGTKSIGLVIDNNPETVPEFITKSLITKYQANNVMDGSWYLHAQFLLSEEWTKISHFRFNIDTTPPELRDPIISEAGDVKKMLQISAIDRTSGLDKYILKINDTGTIALNRDVKEYNLDYLAPGAYQMSLDACDLAGNCSSVIKKFNVLPELENFNEELLDQLNRTQKYLMWSLMLILLLTLFLIIHLLMKLLGRVGLIKELSNKRLIDIKKIGKKIVRKK